MLRLKVETVCEGQHPSEVVVSVTTADGQSEQLVVDTRSLKDNTVEVGYAVGRDNDRFLVELPRETSRGLWRLWVPKDSLVPSPVAA
jgi:hypothetical protein